MQHSHPENAPARHPLLATTYSAELERLADQLTLAAIHTELTGDAEEENALRDAIAASSAYTLADVRSYSDRAAWLRVAYLARERSN